MSDNNGKSPEEIRAEIERKRSQMSDKIDSIQDRFRPDSLKAEARTLAQDVLRESSDVLMDYVRTNTREVSRAVGESFKRNPVPTALMALGLGWLVYSSVSGRDDERDGYRGYGRPYGRYADDPMDRRARYDGGYGQGYARGYQWSPRQPVSGYAQWEDRVEDMQRRMEREQRGGFVQQAAGRVRNVAENVGAAVSEQASRLSEPVAEAGAALRDKVSDLGSTVSDTVSRMGERAGEAGSRFEEMGEDLRDRAGDLSQQVRYQGGELRHEARDRAMQAQDTLARTLEDNPLAFGAVALLAGAAIGLALPSTRRESMLMGETRDRLVERTQQIASNVAEEVKQVASDVAPQLQETVTQVVDNLTQAGQQVTQQVSGGVKQAADTVAQKVDQVASTVAAQAGSSAKSESNG